MATQRDRISRGVRSQVIRAPIANAPIQPNRPNHTAILPPDTFSDTSLAVDIFNIYATMEAAGLIPCQADCKKIS